MTLACAEQTRGGIGQSARQGEYSRAIHIRRIRVLDSRLVFARI
jgi:hypothetical protein